MYNLACIILALSVIIIGLFYFRMQYARKSTHYNEKMNLLLPFITRLTEPIFVIQQTKGVGVVITPSDFQNEPPYDASIPMVSLESSLNIDVNSQIRYQHAQRSV